MISRVNFTERRRIPRRAVLVHVIPGDPPHFEATLDLEELDFPSDAAVVVEATRAGATSVQRFAFGTIGDPLTPEDRALDEIAGEHIKFAVKVIDQRDEVGRLLGLVEGIRPESAGGGPEDRRPILPVKPADLGERLWRLLFDESDVYLEVNRAVPQIKELVQGDERFIGLVYPEIIRQVLERVIVVEGHGELTNDEDDWRDLWLRFGIGWHPGGEHPPAVERLDNVARADLDEWIDEVVGAFCEERGLRRAFLARSEAEGGP